MESEYNSLNEEPTINCYKNAKFRNQIKCYRIKQNINDLKKCIVNKHPLIFSISVYDSFYKFKHIELPNKKDKKLKDICMILIGYNDEEREWLIQHDKVYKISYKYLLNKKLCKDFWHIQI